MPLRSLMSGSLNLQRYTEYHYGEAEILKIFISTLNDQKILTCPAEQ